MRDKGIVARQFIANIHTALSIYPKQHTTRTPYLRSSAVVFPQDRVQSFSLGAVKDDAFHTQNMRINASDFKVSVNWGAPTGRRLYIGLLGAYRILDDGSRMSREAHVRFCEGLGVQFPRPTHPYVWTWQGWQYVAFVIDVYARCIVGWKVGASMKTDFVHDVLEQALYARKPGNDGVLIHHSDRGSQYMSIRYTERLTQAGIEPCGGQPWRQLRQCARRDHQRPVQSRTDPPPLLDNQGVLQAL